MDLNYLEVGKASDVNVLRLQIRQNELRQQKEVLLQENKEIQAAINSLMNLPYDKEVVVVGSFEIPEEGNYYNYENLDVNPELLKYDKLYQSVEQAEVLNKKERAPKIGRASS